MLKEMGWLFGVILFAITLSGCNNDKGSDFVGRWVSVSKDGAAEKSLMVVDIVPEGEVFHIDVQSTYDGFSRKISKTSKYEGKAESETVLSVTGAPVLLNMRLEGQRMFFDGKELIKSK